MSVCSLRETFSLIFIIIFFCHLFPPSLRLFCIFYIFALLCFFSQEVFPLRFHLGYIHYVTTGGSLGNQVRCHQRSTNQSMYHGTNTGEYENNVVGLSGGFVGHTHIPSVNHTEFSPICRRIFRVLVLFCSGVILVTCCEARVPV